MRSAAMLRSATGPARLCAARRAGLGRKGFRVCEWPRWKLTWLPAAGADLVPLTLVDFGYLVTKRRLEDEDAFQDYVNEHTARACAAG